MCFYLAISKTSQELANRYKAKADRITSFQPADRISGFSFPKLPVVAMHEEIDLEEMQWGLIPPWVKSEADALQFRKNTLNAKAETAFEKPSFKNSMITQRCLVPATGFYEWRHEGKEKIPFLVKVPESEVFSLGGIYAGWRNPQSDQIIQSFSVITTQANPLMAFVHNTKLRMPLIIPPELEQMWLDASLNSNDVKALMQPFDERRMTAVRI